MREQQKYTAGIYCRLSSEDSADHESMSIANQREMLCDYVKRQGWEIDSVYVDDGYSGVNFQRPDFQRMIADIEAGKINLVICKDLSRLGRNYILCGQYTEIYFPERGIRFIALNDNVDSAKGDDDFTPFRNILNEWAARDTSRKVAAVYRAKSLEGKHIGNHPLFGYLHDPDDKNKWVIDEEAAEVVRRIFQMTIGGKRAVPDSGDIAERKSIMPILLSGAKRRWKQ